MQDLSQSSIIVDETRNSLLTPFGKKTLENQYLLQGESYQDLFVRVASSYADDSKHAQRLYDYMSKLWFMPSTPILANGGTTRGLPISCFLNETSDSLEGVMALWTENMWLASKGGGIGSYWGNLRSMGEKIGRNGETSGVVPFIKVMDSMTLAISQGSLRRGSAAIYMPVEHPEIEEFIEIRKPTGGDHNRKALNLHHGVVISDDFMKAVNDDDIWHLRSPKDGAVMGKLSARHLWIRLLTTRIETGEPYLLFIDTVNRTIPEHHKKLGLTVKLSNLCSEITLPTGKDHLGVDRTAVCCLSSLNLETYREWENDPLIIEDVLRFLDNVLEDFIQNAPQTFLRATYGAKRERSVGLGVMGFHSFLQANNIPFESVMAKVWNKKIFTHIQKYADIASKKLALERGACPDAKECNVAERFSNKTAIAPTASISIICGGSSPGIEPFVSNAYTHKTLSGSFPIRNKHLIKLLEQKGYDTPDIWSSIVLNEGSVQHLDFLTPHEKDVFKTAFELDQRWIVELAGDRQPFVDQAQSLNLFLLSNIHKRDLHHIHKRAWEVGVKSLYYSRSRSLQRAENTYTAKARVTDPTPSVAPETKNYEECLSCQ
ncbi:MAG TPA: ribonucleoside-diphosphate reductase subunit alpha [Candidatus Babeliaceae bacterium]|nr:ribonucleoside-diphosphate reductase subunit alpha [Candidatus Babeliaceae bacterium]